MSTILVPIFYLHTASDVLAIPETVLISNSVEPHSTKVTFVSVPSLEEGVGVAGRQVVVTLMISGSVLQSRVISSGEILEFSTILYNEIPTPDPLGVIYVRNLVGNDRDARRVDLLRRLNTPDYEVIGLPEGTLPTASARRTVEVSDESMLRLPIREIVRQFSSVFSTASTVIAPSIVTFSNFGSSQSTAFIALPDTAHIVLDSSLIPLQQALLATLPPLEEAEVWQQPIKMTSTGWTVFAVLWVLLGLTFLISVGVTYGWYIAQYL